MVEQLGAGPRQLPAPLGIRLQAPERLEHADQPLAAPHIAGLFARLPEPIESSQVIALRPLAGVVVPV
ncbi:hypothetical protein [Ancylobacter oerskovii]|uniref:Uncharacterized protein n=1 Tax=Ancylobacter oerskovii TaxID=459519 RepID=A0ABW4YTT9_9HYPH|nr:hypothetical protein [Ancylobacter oerskovii]MBS7543727.1 hypothetical protein [Ancylobacter oerskovii]